MMKKKKNIKKNFALTVAFTLMMTFAAVPVTGAVSAADNSDTEKVINQLKQVELDQQPFSYRSKKMQAAAVKAGEDYPEAYDLRDVVDKDGVHHNYVTPVKLQHPFGSCWGFAAIAAAETSILGSGLAEADGYDACGENGYTELDLSEKHLVNFVSTAISDPDNPQYGEGMVPIDENATAADRYNNGGSPYYATSLFSSGMGPVLENRDEIYEYHGTDKEIVSREDSDGNWFKFSYSDEDDWDMPEELRFKQSYVLKESYILPPPANDKNAAKTYTYDPAGTKAIKEQILNNRAVIVSFHADHSEPNKESERKYINPDTWAHYTYEQSLSNHAVTVVGWDDNYSRENFTEGKQPPADMFPAGKEEGRTDGGNGAWLVKNSWGSGENEFPTRGLGEWGITNEEGVHTGYFWLSYYDMSLDMAEALDFDKSNVDQQYYLDQHDYMPVGSVAGTDTENEAKMANVFPAEANEQLNQISCQTAAPGTEVTYQVYLLQEAFQDPEDGILMEEGSASFKYGGFHKFDLQNPVIVQKGQSYSVVITQKLPNGKYNINVPAANGKDFAKMFGLQSYSVGVINEKESYISLDGSWADYSDKEVRTALVGSVATTQFALDNFPIKGYCSMIDDPVRLTASVYKLSLDRNEEEKVTLTMRSSETASIGKPEISWEYAGGDEVFTTECDPASASICMVKAGEVPGKGYLKVTAEGIGTRIIPVDVDSKNKYSVEDLHLEVGQTGQIEIKDHNGEAAAGKFWYYNDTGEVATVSADGTVTAVGEGSETITIKDASRVQTKLVVYVEKSELDTAKEAAKEALEEYRNAKDDSAYDAEGIASLDSAKEAGEQAIDGASDKDAVSKALEDAEAAIDSVQTKAQKEEAADKDAADKEAADKDAANKEAAAVVKNGERFTVNKNTYAVVSAAKGTVKLVKAKNAKKVTVPAAVTYKGKKLSVTGIGPKSFKGTKAKTLIVKSKAFTRRSVKKSLKGSKVKKIKVKVGKKSVNKKYVKKYRKIFTKKNAGRKVSVKR